MSGHFRLAPIAVAASLLIAAACSKSGDAGRPAGAGKAGTSTSGRPVPVMTATAQKRDVPLFLDGLGSVVAYRTVTVRAQVDGRLDQVFFKEGQSVKSGEVLAQVDPRPFLNGLHQAEGQLARDEATFATNKANLLRYEELSQKKLIASQQADDQRGLVAQGEGALRMDRAAVDVAKLNLAYARITSPIDGVVGFRNIDPGNIVRASDPTGIAVVAQLDPVAVIFTLPQDVLPDVAEGQSRGALEVVVSSRDGAKELGRGKLEVIDNAVNAATATLRLKAVLANPGHALWPNQFVKVRLMLAVRPGALVIPAAAIQRGPDGPFVYTVGEDQTVQPRPIALDSLQGPDALLTSGLEAGMTVVTEGQNQLRAGSKVSLRARAGEPGKSEGDGGRAAAGARSASMGEGDRERP